MKATSPWLNVILLFGIFIRLPSTYYDGLVFSSNYYSGLKGMDLTPLCHVSTCMVAKFEILSMQSFIRRRLGHVYLVEGEGKCPTVYCPFPLPIKLALLYFISM